MPTATGRLGACGIMIGVASIFAAVEDVAGRDTWRAARRVSYLQFV